MSVDVMGRYALHEGIVIRFESRLGGGTCYIFHNGHQILRQGGSEEYAVFRELRTKPQTVAELTQSTGLEPEDLVPFLEQLETKGFLEMVADAT